MTTETYRAKAFLDACAKMGLAVTVGTDRQPALAKHNPAGHLELDFHSLDASTGTIVEFARQYGIDAVVATEDRGTVLAAQAAGALGLKHNPVAAVRMSLDKYATRRRLSQAGLFSPEFTRVPLEDDPVLVATRVEYPCVIKPLFLSASRGVIRANDAGEFLSAWLRLVRLLRQPDVVAQGGSMAGSILIESYIPGSEVALEGLLSDGRLKVLALFDKPDEMSGPYFEETYYVTPSRLETEARGQIVETVTRAVAALGLRQGPIHAELRINQRGTWVLEIAPRSIGGLCARTLRFGEDLSLEEIILRHALDIDVSSLDRESCASGVLMIPIPGRGVLRAVSGRDQAGGVAGVTEVRITIPIGHEVIPLPEGNRYLGFIFARGETPGFVEAALREASRRLDIDITPGADGNGG